jgi:hypothetical protein
MPDTVFVLLVCATLLKDFGGIPICNAHRVYVDEELCRRDRRSFEQGDTEERRAAGIFYVCDEMILRKR